MDGWKSNDSLFEIYMKLDYCGFAGKTFVRKWVKFDLGCGTLDSIPLSRNTLAFPKVLLKCCSLFVNSITNMTMSDDI